MLQKVEIKFCSFCGQVIQFGERIYNLDAIYNGALGLKGLIHEKCAYFYEGLSNGVGRNWSHNSASAHHCSVYNPTPRPGGMGGVPYE